MTSDSPLAREGAFTRGFASSNEPIEKASDPFSLVEFTYRFVQVFDL
jgi:hypothetical protein